MNVESQLREHYAREIARCASGSEIGDGDRVRLARAMAVAMKEAASQEKACGARPANDACEALAFAASQASFVDVRIWAVQAALVAAMATTCLFGDERLISIAASALGAIAAISGLPAVLAAKAFGTAELEYACRFDCRAAAFARMLSVGAAQATALLLSAFVLPALAQADAFSVLMQASAPFFATCAGALFVARKASCDTALPLACLWGALVLAVSIVAFTATPGLYTAISAWAWGAASLAAFAFALVEARAWIVAAGFGLDALAGERGMSAGYGIHR